MNKRPLQITMAVMGAIPVLTGILGLFGLSDPLYASVSGTAVLDSNLRFFGGVWLGLGVALYWLIPHIDEQTALFRALWGMIFLGGVGRIASMIFFALPPEPFLAFTALEILGAPLFVWWQARVAKSRH